MPKKELVDYIERELNKGIHENRIKNALFEVGHQIEQVEEALLHVKRKQKKRLYMMVTVIVLAFLILVIGAGLLLDKALSDKEIQNISDSNVNTNQIVSHDDNFYYQKAMNEGNEVICESIVDLKFKTTCVENVKKTKDIKIPLVELKDRKIYKEAIENKDSTKCEEIQGYAMKNSCLQLTR